MIKNNFLDLSHKNIVKIIIFDFGGVIQELLDERMRMGIASSMNVPIDTLNFYYQKKISLLQAGEITEEEFIKYLADSMSTSPPDNYYDLLTAPFSNSSHLYKPMVSVLEEMNRREFPIAVLSNTIPSHASLNRRRGNYRWFGENVFLSFEIGFVKPSPESFIYVSSKVEKDMSELLLIDDDEININIAKSLGVNAIHHDSRNMSANSLINKLGYYSVYINEDIQ